MPPKTPPLLPVEEPAGLTANEITFFEEAMLPTKVSVPVLKSIFHKREAPPCVLVFSLAAKAELFGPPIVKASIDWIAATVWAPVSGAGLPPAPPSITRIGPDVPYKVVEVAPGSSLV